MTHRRSRSRHQQVFETAFVTSAGSSVEDLDQVDRIANHPLLQNRGSIRLLPKSRSAMGGSVDRGASAFLAAAASSADVSDYSPVNMRMSRSTTLHLTTATGNQQSRGQTVAVTSNRTTPSSEHWSWRPRSALTRIMRITKPRSCDNILEESRRRQQQGSVQFSTPPPPGYSDGGAPSTEGISLAPSSSCATTPPVSTWRQIPISRSTNNILSVKTPPPQSDGINVRRDSSLFVPKSFSNDNLLSESDNYKRGFRCAETTPGSSVVHIEPSKPGYPGSWHYQQFTSQTARPDHDSSLATARGHSVSPASRGHVGSPAGRGHVMTSPAGRGHMMASPASRSHVIISPAGSRGHMTPKSPTTKVNISSSCEILNNSRSREESPVIELEKYDESPGANIRRGFDLAKSKQDKASPPPEFCSDQVDQTEPELHSKPSSASSHKSVIQLKNLFLNATENETVESPRFPRCSELSGSQQTNYSSDSAPDSREMSPFPVAKKLGGIGVHHHEHPIQKSDQLFRVNIPTPPGTAPAQKRIISIHRDGSSYQYSPRIGSDTNVFRLSELRQSSSAESTPQRTAAGPRFRNRRRGGLEIGGGGGKFKGSRFGSSTSSSCISSWESIHSSTSSQGYGSEATSTCTVAASGGDRLGASSGGEDSNAGGNDQQPRMKRLHNLNILSPISDKSADQISPSSDKDSKDSGSTDNNANNVTAADDELLDNNSKQQINNSNSSNNKKQTRNLNLNLNLTHPTHPTTCDNQTVAALKNLRTPDIQQYLNVPWDMPKLKKKLQYRRTFCFGTGSENSSPDISPKKSNTLKTLDLKLLSKGGNSQEASPRGSSVEPMSMSGSYTETFMNDSSLVLPNNGDNSPISKDPPPLVMRPKRFPKQKGLELYSRCEGSDSGISISSQEMKELMDVPWSMPKLKRNAWLRTKPRDGLELPIPGRTAVDNTKNNDSDNIEVTAACDEHTANSIENINYSNCDTTRNNDNTDAKDNSSHYNIPVSIIDTVANPPDDSLPFSMPKLERRLKTLSNSGGVIMNHSIQLMGPTSRVPELGLQSGSGYQLEHAGTTQLDREQDEIMVNNASLHLGTSKTRLTKPRNIQLEKGVSGSVRLNEKLNCLGGKFDCSVSPRVSTSETHLTLIFNTKPPPGPSKPKPSSLSLPIGGGTKSAPNLPLFTAGSGVQPLTADNGSGGIRRRAGLPPLPQLSFGFGTGTDVDASLPLESQGWYHGILSKTEVESVLRSREECSYLVRSAGDGDYSLAIKSAKGFIHLRVRKRNTDAYTLGDEDREFASVVDIVKHYSLNRLPIKGAEHLSLLTPATQELL